MPMVIVQKWEESERGWGVRPDGYSIHRSMEALGKYLKNYWDSMPDEAPDEYSRPSGKPYPADVDLGSFENLDNRDGIRYWSNNYPGDGGTDGWKNAS